MNIKTLDIGCVVRIKNNLNTVERYAYGKPDNFLTVTQEQLKFAGHFTQITSVHPTIQDVYTLNIPDGGIWWTASMLSKWKEEAI